MNKILQQFLIIWLLLFPIYLFAQESRQNQQTKIEQTNLLMVEGGTFNMGQKAEEYILRRVTVSSFYIDATEVTNKEYRDFVTCLAKEGTMILNDMLPDTSIWVRCTGAEVGSQLAKDYFRVAAFDYYPVVGVSWMQATAFAKWRSDRKNEQMAIESGNWTANFQKKYRFSTSKFLAGDYHEKEGKELPKDFNVLLPNYRLLSEAEWEFAAWALIGKQELTDEGFVRNQIFNPQATKGKDKHPKRAIDEYRKLVLQHAEKYPLPSYYEIEKYKLPTSVFEGDINRYGIYNLNSNVAEWVKDSYRPIAKTTVVNPNTPAPNVERGTNVDAVPADKINIMDRSWEEVVANGKAAERSRAIDANSLMVLKGTSGAAMKDRKSPGNRYSAKASGQYERLIGFRCGMTRTGLNEFER